MVVKRNQNPIVEERAIEREQSPLVEEKYPSVEGMVIRMTYFQRGENPVLMNRMVNVYPDTDHAYFLMPCMIRECEIGGFDLGPVIDAMVKKKEKSREGTMTCMNREGELPEDHATIQYRIELDYWRGGKRPARKPKVEEEQEPVAVGRKAGPQDRKRGAGRRTVAGPTVALGTKVKAARERLKADEPKSGKPESKAKTAAPPAAKAAATGKKAAKAGKAAPVNSARGAGKKAPSAKVKATVRKTGAQQAAKKGKKTASLKKSVVKKAQVGRQTATPAKGKGALKGAVKKKAGKAAVKSSKISAAKKDSSVKKTVSAVQGRAKTVSKKTTAPKIAARKPAVKKPADKKQTGKKSPQKSSKKR